AWGAFTHALPVVPGEPRLFIQCDRGCVALDDIEYEFGRALRLCPSGDAPDELRTDPSPSCGRINPHADDLADVAALMSRSSGHTHITPIENRDERRELDHLCLPTIGSPLRSFRVRRAERVRGILQR